MPVSALMRVIIDCENRLGAIPPGNLHQGRATTHHILTKAMTKRRLTEDDLRVALDYCVREQLRIDSPLQLLPFIDTAKGLVASPDAVHTGLDQEMAAAIAWENDHAADPGYDYWITRLARTIGPKRRDVIGEWRKAGRG